MNRPSLEMADIVHSAGDDFIKRSRRWINWQHQKVLLAITRCRTAALGKSLEEVIEAVLERSTMLEEERPPHLESGFRF